MIGRSLKSTKARFPSRTACTFRTFAFWTSRTVFTETFYQKISSVKTFQKIKFKAPLTIMIINFSGQIFVLPISPASNMSPKMAGKNCSAGWMLRCGHLPLQRFPRPMDGKRTANGRRPFRANRLSFKSSIKGWSINLPLFVRLRTHEHCQTASSRNATCAVQTCRSLVMFTVRFTWNVHSVGWEIPMLWSSARSIGFPARNSVYLSESLTLLS